MGDLGTRLQLVRLYKNHLLFSLFNSKYLPFSIFQPEPHEQVLPLKGIIRMAHQPNKTLQHQEDVLLHHSGNPVGLQEQIEGFPERLTRRRELLLGLL